MTCLNEPTSTNDVQKLWEIKLMQLKCVGTIGTKGDV